MSRAQNILTMIAVGQTIVIISLTWMLTGDPPAPPPTIVRGAPDAAYRACIAGWHKTIDDWNASTAQLNKILAGDK